MARPPWGFSHAVNNATWNQGARQTMTETAIADLSNLGPKSQAMLIGAGIHTVPQLRQLGSVRAYAMVKATRANASQNLLWALEGALSGLSWQVVAKEHRLSLLLALEAMNCDA
jgi:DNA transformation protein